MLHKQWVQYGLLASKYCSRNLTLIAGILVVVARSKAFLSQDLATHTIVVDIVIELKK